MSYAIVAAQSWTPEFVKAKVTNDLSAAFDHMVAENRRTGQAMEIWNRETGKMLRRRETVTKIDLSSIKLTDAMRKALESDDSGLTGLSGKVNTLRALESRGLVKLDNCSVARLTSLGRQYRAQKKGA